ncbi:scavenger receptor cysteine-rich type 1 protein M130-like [Megalops cyprinoides]|uniref:scavenger receptor cysteine-rich type 1 protein M130-like n=1 Tax=Megalops cyprinoides TaxID=118141 RepID=UPI001864731B|nr:scavenger receptor cysteine-rich type 1 protein M130-like [Megalops cyprinoides]
MWEGFSSCDGTESALIHCDLPEPDGGGVRLVGGTTCSGRVEVHDGNTWGTVCDADFDQQDAEVVCRELGCGVPVEVRGAAAFGKGEGQVWSEEIQCRGNESQIYLCPTSPTQKQNCPHENDVGLVCSSSTDIRLVDGGSPCAGRVEVRHGEQWGTVCSDGWDMTDAEVVCRQLGCGAAVEAPSGAHFFPGSGRIWLSDVSCNGSESTLKNCDSGGWGNHNCDHKKDVGVICLGRRQQRIRLVGGTHLCSGRVEVRRGNTWGTVCDADFDQQDAEVVCRELGCGVPVEVRGAAAFGKGEGQVWSEEIQCRGNESQIHFCSTSPTQKQNCPHENDVGLVCSGSDDVRLVDGGSPCAGRVEVRHEGQWGTVCDRDWDKTDAEVVCKQLGCGATAVALYAAQSPTSGKIEGKGPIWMSDVFCKKVRLVGGTTCSGRVEVHYGNAWGTVCDAAFDQQDAEVVCRELGCGVPARLLGAAAFGKGEGQVWSEEIQCRGNESQIHFCPTSPTQKQNCPHENDVGLVCSGYTESRLVNGPDRCSGRVELKYLSAWGTVCDACWDMRASNVLCQQLSCGRAVALLGQAWFGEGNGSVWADVFECQGNETHVSQCAASACSRATFSHGQDAGVICSGSSLSALDGMVQLSGERECEGQVDCVGNETSLWECPKAEWGQTDCGHKQDVVVMCSEFKQLRLRMRTDTKVCSGLAEVFYNGTWGSVCVNGMTEATATVICRQLGCGDRGTLSTGTTSDGVPQWINNIKCRRHDESLWQCPSAWSDDCPRKDISPNDSSPQQETTQVQQCPEPPELRLVGPSKCSGRVEVRIEGSWGTVCDDSWDMREAQVVCRQLGCGLAMRVEGNAAFGRGNGTIWLDEVNCTGDELHLWDCCRSPLNQSDCSHKEDAGVTCAVVTARSPPPVNPTSSRPLSIPAVAFLVLGALFFLLLAVLVVLLFRNRDLKKALYQRDPAPRYDAVYEEIEYKLPGERTYGAPRRGSVLSEDLPPGYDDVGNGDGHSLLGDSAREETGEEYDDVIAEENTGDLVTENIPDSYDDVITVDPVTGSVAAEKVKTTEGPLEMGYDDAGEESIKGGGEQMRTGPA